MMGDRHYLKMQRHHVVSQLRHDYFLQVEPRFGRVACPLIENACDPFQHLQVASDTRVMK